MEGQFDSIPTFFLLLGLFFASKKPTLQNIIYCGLALGIGGAVKHYPFLLLLPFLIIFTQRTRDRVVFLVTAILPYVICIPGSFNQDFIQSLTFGENYKMFESGIMIGDIKISFYLCLYVILSLQLLFEKNKTLDTLIKYCFLFTSIYFITSFWFVQRILFLMPPLLLLAGTRKKIMVSLPVLYVAYFIYAFFLFPGLFDHTLLRPIFPRVQPITYELFFPLLTIKTYIFSGMVGLIIWLIYAAITEKRETEAITLRNITIPAVTVSIYIILLIGLAFFHA